MNVKEIGLRKPVKKDRKFSCTFDDNCEEFFPYTRRTEQALAKCSQAYFQVPQVWIDLWHG